MSNRYSPAGVAGSLRVSGTTPAHSFTASPPFAHMSRRIALVALGLALFGSLLGSTMVSAQDATSGGLTYAEAGFSIPDEAAQSLVQNTPSSGDAIANYAMQFLGYPYVWAGNTPAGFDCSGFTQFVILNTLGIDIGHGVADQAGYGAWVDWGAWQPGDLVYFAGTYRAGISHTGVYIGDGQFIHAENEDTGVVISSLYSDYYGGHYYGAFRLW